MFDKFREACGIFGILGRPEAANLTYLGLYALQHRGQESAGIVVSDGQTLHLEKGMGLVADVFSEARLRRLKGSVAIGHVRYSTTGSSQLKNAQPIVASYRHGGVALAHNGNLVNAHVLKAELEARGSIFSSTTDSEVIVHLIARSGSDDLVEATAEALSRVSGAYSLVVMNETELLGIRDPHGFRPLSLGRLGQSWVLASESCAFDLIEATFVRDVEPGEFVRITADGVKSYRPLAASLPAQCIFEYIYFSRPDSLLYGQNVAGVRKALGRRLAREAPAEADLVIPVPDSGLPAALGFAQESGLPFDHGLIRNHYVGRTFIEPKQAIRHFGVKIKLNPVREILEGKRVVVVDDSIVRGTTSRKIVSMLRSAGAREVHMRISAPPTISPCYYGIDTPTRKELIASSHSVEEIRRYIRADSLGYLSMQGLLAAVGKDAGFCHACFSLQYPVAFPMEDLAQLRLFEP
ncbi:MAG: amidophosphoribosyltransferase [candidate division NC10 bacterium]|nr:amidophosphoribosyltransferase [candidate division NC10 bacterium]MBI2458681.1 amidophosphoribosyltransferase [candidate division NC10 bacterium]